MVILLTLSIEKEPYSHHPNTACAVQFVPSVGGDRKTKATPECQGVLLYPTVFSQCIIFFFLKSIMHLKKKQQKNPLICIVKSEVKIAQEQNEWWLNGEEWW